MARSVVYLLFIACFCQAYTKQYEAYFEEISTSQGDDEHNDGDFAMSNSIHGSLHRCSVSEEDCNFVVKDKRKNEYSLIANQKDLPEMREGYRIWKKMYLAKSVAEVKTAEKAYESCKKAHEKGISNNGAITLKLRDGLISKASCDMKKDEGGWTVFQRRIDGTISFDRGWDDYVRGFGNVTGNFWLGLEALHQLTKEGKVKLRIDLKGSNDETGYAKYDGFTISGKEKNFTISFGNFNGDIGDSLRWQYWTDNNGRPFSTKDRDNDAERDNGNCAEKLGGPWWHQDCSHARLNARYSSSNNISRGKELVWMTWKKNHNPIRITFSEMKLRRED